jgi:hypothetical protein
MNLPGGSLLYYCNLWLYYNYWLFNNYWLEKHTGDCVRKPPGQHPSSSITTSPPPSIHSNLLYRTPRFPSGIVPLFRSGSACLPKYAQKTWAWGKRGTAGPGVDVTDDTACRVRRNTTPSRSLPSFPRIRCNAGPRYASHQISGKGLCHVSSGNTRHGEVLPERLPLK